MYFACFQCWNKPLCFLSVYFVELLCEWVRNQITKHIYNCVAEAVGKKYFVQNLNIIIGRLIVIHLLFFLLMRQCSKNKIKYSGPYIVRPLYQLPVMRPQFVCITCITKVTSHVAAPRYVTKNAPQRGSPLGGGTTVL